MSCINYWNECTNAKCENVSYDRKKINKCIKCGADNDSTREWDEEGDYYETD